VVVDASQGVEAADPGEFVFGDQAGMEIIPVINKIDLPSAELSARRR